MAGIAHERRPALSTTITWLGHATVLLHVGPARVLTDPVLRRGVAHLRRHAPAPVLGAEPLDAVLLSHLHRDHTDGPSLRRLPPRTPVFVPAGAGPTVRRLGVRSVQEVPVGHSAAIAPGVTARAVPAIHDGRRSPVGRWAEAIGWILEGERRVYFAGDTAVFDDMRTIARGVDVALLPVAGWGPSLGPGHMGPAEAARATALIRPRLAIPIHWGTLQRVALGRRRRMLLTAPGRAFADLCADTAPETEVVVLRPGERLDLGESGDGRGRG